MQVVQRPEPALDIQLPMHILAQCLPFIQALTVLTIALAAHIPGAVCGLYLKAYNPGNLRHELALNLTLFNRHFYMVASSRDLNFEQ